MKTFLLSATLLIVSIAQYTVADIMPPLPYDQTQNISDHIKDNKDSNPTAKKAQHLLESQKKTDNAQDSNISLFDKIMSFFSFDLDNNKSQNMTNISTASNNMAISDNLTQTPIVHPVNIAIEDGTDDKTLLDSQLELPQGFMEYADLENDQKTENDQGIENQTEQYSEANHYRFNFYALNAVVDQITLLEFYMPSFSHMSFNTKIYNKFDDHNNSQNKNWIYDQLIAKINITTPSHKEAQKISPPANKKTKAQNKPTISQTPKSNRTIDKYKKELLAKKTNPPKVKKLSQSELNSYNAQQLTPKQKLFIQNESSLLALPSDDIVLGKITTDAKLKMMDLRLYIPIFWENYHQLQRNSPRIEMNDFIAQYNKNSYKDDYLYYEDHISYALREAINAINSQNISLLITLLDKYPIIHLSSDENNNSLLHNAVYAKNYSAAKLLIIKGIDISLRNNKNQTALHIARKLHYDDIVFLIRYAFLPI